MSVTADITRYLPSALFELQECRKADEQQKVIQFHLAEALDDPGDLTKEKVQSFFRIIQSYYPKDFLLSQLKEISSIFTQVIYLNAAFDAIGKVDKPKILEGGTGPLLIQGKLLPELNKVNLGVFKRKFKSATFHIDSHRKGAIRERLAYLTDKKHVPPTFILDTVRKGMGTFSLFFQNIETLYYIKIELLSFPRAYVRDLAFSEIRRMNADAALTNVLLGTDRKTLKFIDAACAFPENPSRHRISVLFSKVFIGHLSGNYSEEELSEIQKIDVDAVCTLFKKHGLEETAVRTHRCVLLMLKSVPAAISLEDLLVITNISNPRGYYFCEDNDSCYFYGENTLFSYIAEGKTDEQINARIRTVFNTILYLKSPDNPRPLPEEEPGFLRSFCPCFFPPVRVPPGNADEEHVYDYYHAPDKVVFLQYLTE